MSATLYAMVILQGSTLSFSPGYTSVTECQSVYTGPHVRCFPYDPNGLTWSAFFKQPDGTLRAVTRIPSQGDCERIIATMKDDVPRACRQLDQPYPCAVSCKIEMEPPQPPPPAGTIPPPAERTEPKPDPAKLTTSQIENRDVFADVSVGPSELRPEDRPFIEAAQPPKQTRRVVRTAQRQRYAYAQQFDPIGALVSFFALRGEW